MRVSPLLLLLPFLSLSGASINLPLNDINIVVVTDVHSWVAGHSRHESQWDADYGHVLSFYEQLQKAWTNENLLFVMNGDFTDGTGLSTYPPSNLTEILKKMPWDALNIGNHELYRNSTIEHITDGGFADYWGSKYITSNVFRLETGKPLGGSQWRIWEGPSANVLLFGFLYDMEANAGLVTIEPVEQVVEQSWFVDALSRQQYEAIVCLVHMDYKDELISVILKKIRSTVGENMPVQFISGHSHIRAYTEVDNHSTSFEAGHYLDTVGFVSFDKEGRNFQHEFIDANVNVLQSVAGVDDIMTENGRQLQAMIRDTQDEMGLFKKIGCSPDHYFVYNKLSHPQSLWKLYMEKVINEYYFDGSSSFVFAQGNGAFRYDIFKGNVTVDDLKSVDPYNDKIWKVTNALQGRDLLQVFGGKLNHVEETYAWATLPQYICSMDNVDVDKTYEFYTANFDLEYFVDRVQTVTGKKVEPIAQNIGTSQLWVDFVSSKWQEEQNCQAAASRVDPNLLIGVGLTAAAVLVISILFVTARRGDMHEYDRAIENRISGEDVEENELI